MPVKPTLLLLGCGQLNRKVYQNLHREFAITAVSRTPMQLPLANHLVLDLATDNLASLPPADFMVFCLTPATYDEQGYRRTFVHCLSNVLDHFSAKPPKRFLFVSSTSVYAQQNDEVVTEQSPTNPNKFNGKILLEAEALLKKSTIPTTAVRFSGIYGHHRMGLLQQIRHGRKSSRPPSPYTNRISETDAVAVLCHLLTRAQQGYQPADCYLASDCLPTRMHDLVAWVRQQILCQPESVTLNSSRAGSKRCHSGRLRETGFVFQHPTYQEGYAEIIASSHYGRDKPENHNDAAQHAGNIKKQP